MTAIEINHHYPNSDPDVARRLGRIEKALSHIIEKVEKMALDFVPLETEVAEIGTVVDSAVTLLGAIAQDIRDNIANQAKLAALATQLDDKARALGEAVAANTPADPAPTP
jgi:hypothetical protein